VLLVVAALVAAYVPAMARAEAPAAETKEEESRKQVLEAVHKGEYKKALPALEELVRKSRQKDVGDGVPLPTPTSADTDEHLKAELEKALQAGNYDLADYYVGVLEQRHESPDIFSWALDLTVWTIVVFLLLFFILQRYAWKPMLAGLEKREKDIHSAVADAQKARDEAQRLKGEIQSEREQMEAMRRDTIDKARAEAQRVADETLAAAKAEAQAERDRARRELETAKDQAIRELWAQTAELATLVSSKAIRRQMTIEDQQRLVDEAIVEMGPAAAERQRSVASV
jgi:F-type H+-transporting ATPase subunit b